MEGCVGGRQKLQPGSRNDQGAACRWPERISCWPPGGRQQLGLAVGLVKELHAFGQEQQAAGCQEGERSLDLVVVLVLEMFVGGWEEQAAGH